MMLTKRISFFAGIICGLSFSPIYFSLGLFTLSILTAQIYQSPTVRHAAMFGYWFGFGFFLSVLYWISFGVMVYVDEFWWFIPFALLGLPAALAIFIAIVAMIAWWCRRSSFYHILFCVIWVINEWFMSWIFTGLPWAMLGYIFSISEVLIQSASIIGILGLNFIAVFIGSIFYSYHLVSFRIMIAFMMILLMIVYGTITLRNNETEYSEIKIRIVQPSIPQIAKWQPEIFWINLNQHISMSQAPGDPDIIIWSEAALTIPFYYQGIYDRLLTVFTKDNQFLLTGGVSDNGLSGDDYEIYSALIALNSSGHLLFDYHKTHLVPFGEYIPFKKYMPIKPMKKITHGIEDYTPGKGQLVYIPALNLTIKPMICYESIFSDEVRVDNRNVDVMINVTNDAWYGKSSGPFQHFEISRMRAVENGLPIIRAGNNGISAIIDPLGRVIAKLDLNAIDILDGYLPKKLSKATIFSVFGPKGAIFLVLLVLILQKICFIFIAKRNKKKLFS